MDGTALVQRLWITQAEGMQQVTEVSAQLWEDGASQYKGQMDLCTAILRWNEESRLGVAGSQRVGSPWTVPTQEE